DLGEALLGDLRSGGDIDEERDLGGLRRLRHRDRAAGIVGADQERAAVADQALGDHAAALRLRLGVAVDELHRRAAPPFYDLHAEIIALAGLLAHERLDTGEIEDHADLDRRALRHPSVRQNPGAGSAQPRGQQPTSSDDGALGHEAVFRLSWWSWAWTSSIA